MSELGSVLFVLVLAGSPTRGLLALSNCDYVVPAVGRPPPRLGSPAPVTHLFQWSAPTPDRTLDYPLVLLAAVLLVGGVLVLEWVLSSSRLDFRPPGLVMAPPPLDPSMRARASLYITRFSASLHSPSVLHPSRLPAVSLL